MELIEEGIYFFIFLIIYVSLYMYIKVRKFKLLFIYTFIGTLFHELSHFIIGIMLYAKPVNFSLIPKKNGDSYTLGSVSFSNITYYNALPVALAPIILIYFAYYIYIQSLSFNIYYQMIFSYISFNMLISSKPSSEDFKILILNFFSIIFYTILFFGFYYREVIYNVLQSNIHNYFI